MLQLPTPLAPRIQSLTTKLSDFEQQGISKAGSKGRKGLVSCFLGRRGFGEQLSLDRVCCNPPSPLARQVMRIPFGPQGAQKWELEAERPDECLR